MEKAAKTCPSAPWSSAGARIFGVVGGDARAPRVMFLKQVVSPSKELEAQLGGVQPEQVFRVAAPCAGSGCGHHNHATKACNLVDNIVQHVEVAYEDYAVCSIRSTCLWWSQRGVEACKRCPQIATRNLLTSEQLALAATVG